MIAGFSSAYWVIDGRFMAGELPACGDATETLRRLRQLLDLGIDAFVDLTQEGEYGVPPYEPQLRQAVTALEAERAIGAVEYTRLAIADRGLPSPDLARRGLDLLTAHLAAGRKIYLHCFGGVGRTGTLVGCYLAEHGFPGEAALRELARLRGPELALLESPETPAQCAFVRNWSRV
jgi:hypothetical protein